MVKNNHYGVDTINSNLIVSINNNNNNNNNNNCKGQKRAKRPKAVMDPSPRSPNNEFVESRNKS